MLAEHPALPIRNAAARSLASAVKERPDLSKQGLQEIASRYQFLVSAPNETRFAIVSTRHHAHHLSWQTG